MIKSASTYTLQMRRRQSGETLPVEVETGFTMRRYSTQAPLGRTGLICARMQPLHLGHVSLITHALNEACDQLILIMGSAQESNSLRNPYSKDLRLKMLENVFSSEIESKRLKIIPVDDIFNPPKWAEHVLSFCPQIDIYFAGSQEDASLFKDAQIETAILPRELSSFKSGTDIRKMISDGNLDWRKYVPEVNWDLVSKYKEIL